MLRITKYAQRLLDGLDTVDYIERVKLAERNWIGRSEGAEVDFMTTAGDKLRVYTTRPDTLFGATYMVMSPEHPYISRWADRLSNMEEIRAYQAEAARKSDFERAELDHDKTGVRLDGVLAVNPVNGREIPIYISDYVLMNYGTGAIMAVPAHDTRDWEFAKKFGLPIIEVVAGGDVQNEAFTDVATGKMVNSGFLDGMEVAEAKKAIVAYLKEKGIGEPKVNYKLRDWVFARQRYWGEPIPIVICPKCGFVPLSEDDLPLRLPDVESYEPTDNGESPLAKVRDWVEVTCPHCGGPAERETDTMPNWAGSSWYFLRYMDPHNDKALASPEAIRYWGQVDWYNGGMEHATLHMLYSRFWNMFLHDIGVVPNDEPYAKRTSHGMILGENGEKMSKSRGNVVDPMDVINEYGADTLRLYEMFIGDFEKTAPWSTAAIKGCRRFLDRVWALYDRVQPGDEYDKNVHLVHETIKKVTDDIENMKFNTAIAAMMTLVNSFYENGCNRAEYALLIQLLNPFAPHITEELWEMLGNQDMLVFEPWPEYDEAKMARDTIELPVQVNGRLRATVTLPRDVSREDALKAALADERIAQAVAGKNVVKNIVVPGKIINIVVK